MVVILAIFEVVLDVCLKEKDLVIFKVGNLVVKVFNNEAVFEGKVVVVKALRPHL